MRRRTRLSGGPGGWWATVAAGVVAVLAGVGLLGPVEAPSGGNAWFAQVVELEEYRDHEGLDAATYLPDFNPDAAIDRLRLDAPDAYAVAIAEYDRFEPPETADVHEIFRLNVERALDLDPDLATIVGAHPHPHGITPVEDGRVTCLLTFLARDALRALTAWQRNARPTPHESIDFEIYKASLEYALRIELDDRDRLARTVAWFDPLFTLSRFACCDVDQRAAAAAARLDAIAAALPNAAERLDDPPRALVLHAAERLDDARAYLRTYADGWDGVSAATRHAVGDAADRAGAAIDRTLEALRGPVLARATGELGVGPARYALTLRLQYAIQRDAGDVAQLAWNEFEEGAREAREFWDAWVDGAHEPASKLTIEDRIRALRSRLEEWVPAAPAGDITPTVIPFPRLWGSTFAGAYYVEAPLLAKPNRPFVVVGAGDDSEDAYASAQNRSILAHEAYPGHHLQAVAARDACLLRRFHSNATAAEGWATYAEGLAHGAVSHDVLHGFVHAEARYMTGWYALMDVLLHTRVASAEQVFRWMQDVGMAETEADLGAFAAYPGQTLTYLVGHSEIEQLLGRERKRLGLDFDLRAFHARFLRAGYVPPHLLDLENE